MAYSKIKKDGKLSKPSSKRIMPLPDDFRVICNEYIKKCTDSNSVPLIGELALICGVDTDTIGKYRQKSPYGGIIKRIDQMCENALLRKGINENKPVFSMFLLKAKYGYIEQQYQKIDINHSGQIGVVHMPSKRPKVG